MATVAQLRAHLSAPPAKNAMEAKKVAQLRRYAMLTGAHGGNAGAGYEAPDSAGESVFKGVTHVGSNVLNALSVPQAVVFTGAAKAAGKDLSWKNMFGNFRKDASGRVGGDAALNSLGVTNAMARLGISLVADPLWLVGGGLVKTPKFALEAGKLLSNLKTGETALKESRAVMSRFLANSARAKTPEATKANYKKAMEAKKEVDKLANAVAQMRKDKHISETDLDKLLKFDKDTGGINNIADALQKLRIGETHANRRKGMNYSLNLGVGKAKKKIDLGISAERSLIGKNFRQGMMAMKPVEKVAHALRRSGGEMAEAVPGEILRVAQKAGLTSMNDVGGVAINKNDAMLIQIARSMRSQNAEAGKEFIKQRRAEGVWHEGHDVVMRQFDERGARQAIDDLEKGSKPFGRELKELDKREKVVRKALKNLEYKRTANNSKGTSKGAQKLLDELDTIAKERKRIAGRGEYTPQGKSQDVLEEEMRIRHDETASGVRASGHQYRLYLDPKKARKEREVYDNPFAVMSRDDMMAAMDEAGFAPDVAENIIRDVDGLLGNKGIEGFRDAAKPGVVVPEWDAFILAGRRENRHIWTQVDKQIDDLAAEAGLTQRGKVGEELVKALKFGRSPGVFASSAAGRIILDAVAKFKGLLTFINPSHYVRNLTGDYWNSMVNGNLRHANPMAPLQSGITKSKTSRLANAQAWAGTEGRQDLEALERVWTIGGRDYTGAELMAMSRMVGLGRGYVGTDIALMNEAFARAKTKPGEFYKFMQRLNIKRENAQRMHTWIKHMEAGEDPIAAGVKTLRVHFDYTQLTDFEKLILRNVLLFYTWMKRNTLLQMSGVVTRPGLYAAAAHMEAARPKIENEPDYYKTMGAIGIPGWGALNVGSPTQDLWKLDASLEGFRRDILGAVTPPIRVPVELATNQKFFTGGNIQKYEGEVTQHGMADLLNKLGIPVGTNTTAKAGGNEGYGINPQLAYVAGQIFGPQAATAQSLSNPDYEGNRLQEGLQRFIGISKQADRPEQFARAKKYREAKKKADATRAKNAQGGN